MAEAYRDEDGDSGLVLGMRVDSKEFFDLVDSGYFKNQSEEPFEAAGQFHPPADTASRPDEWGIVT
jgi:hypothetical protein